MKICLTGFLLILSAAWLAAAAPRPDILLIMPDQMRGDCLSILHHPVVRTPTIDRLAQDGALFRRAYSPVPSCIPARFALLTGLNPETTGVVGFESRKITTPTLPELLGQDGYVTVLDGRNMHQDPPNKSVGYQQTVLGSTYVSDDAYDDYLRRVAPQTGGIRKLVTDWGLSLNLWPARPWTLPEAEHPTEWVVRQSEKTIAETPTNQPLFLTASFYSPHPPLFPPPKYFDALMREKMPPPARGDWVDWTKLSTNGNKVGDRILLEGEKLQRAQAGYYGLIEQLDAALPPLIAAFKARSEKAGRPWIIVFTSDHGEMLGDHGYFRKCEPYEGSANIPFIIAASPELGFKPDLRCDQPVTLQDLMPTLLALAGTNVPPRLDGVNLLPALRGEEQRIRDVLHFEHAPCYSQAQAFQALTDGHFKYIWRPHDGQEQLFNLDQDPREEHDLAKVPADHATLVQWRERLIRALAHRPEGFTDGKKLIAGRPYPAVEKHPLSNLY